MENVIDDGLGPSWKIWRRRRYILTMFAFLGKAMKITFSTSMNIALVAMTDQHPVVLDNTTTYVPELDWNSKTKGVILSSFFYGFMVSSFVGGVLAARFGCRRLYIVGLSITSVLNLLIPVVARTSAYLLMFLRLMEGLLEGLISPSIEMLWSRWIPFGERSRHVAIGTLGSTVGDSMGMGLSGFIADTLGWPAMFYITGSMGLLCSAGCLLVLKESPEEDKRISESEILYIRKSLGPKNSAVKERIPIPFRKMLSSGPVWAVLGSSFANSWNYFLFTMFFPAFLKDILGFQLASAGFLATIPYLLEALFIYSTAHTSDILDVRNIIGTTKIRKITISGSLAVAGGLMVLSTMTTNWVAIVTCMAFAQSLLIAGFTMLIVNPLDIAPNYSGVILGMHYGTSSLSGILCPITVGFMTQNKNREEWMNVFYVSAGISLAGAMQYAFLGSGEVQPWALVKKKEDASDSLVQAHC